MGRAVVLVPVVAIGLAVVGTWPLATCLHGCVVEPPRDGIWWIGASLRRDVDLIVWILAWGAHALATQPAALFDANLFHPAPRALATTEHMLGLQVLYLPLRLATGDPLAAHQATLLATFAAAIVTMTALVRTWTGSWIAAVTAGVLYAFSPFRAGHLPALHMEAAWLLPLVVLAVERVAAGGRIGWTLVLAAALAVQALSSYYLGYASFVAVAVLIGVAALDARARPHTGRLVAAMGAALVVVAACSLPYLRARAEGTLAAPDPAYVAAVSAVPGKTGATLAVLLALATAPWWRRGLAADRRPLWLVAVALAGAVANLLALGPSIRLGTWVVPGPFALAEAVVPGWSLVRGPARLNVVTTVAAATLAGVGIAGVSRRLAAWSPALGRLGLVAGLGVALASVPFTMRLPVPLAPVLDAPPVYAWLARAADAPVLELPWHDFEAEQAGVAVEARRLRYSALHWRRLLGGYSGYVPPSYPIVSALVRALPDARALALLVRTTGVRWIVLHRDELDPQARRRWRAARALVRPVAVRGADVVLEPRATAVADLVATLARGTGGATLLGTALQPLAGDARRATVTLDAPVRSIPWLDEAEIGVHVTNDGPVAWPAMATGARHRVTLGYRWLDACGRVLATRDDAGRLPWDVAPGEIVPARIALHRPGTSGAATLAVGVVQDGVWLDGTASERLVPIDPRQECAAAGSDGARLTSSRRRAGADRDPAAGCRAASNRCTASP